MTRYVKGAPFVNTEGVSCFPSDKNDIKKGNWG